MVNSDRQEDKPFGQPKRGIILAELHRRGGGAGSRAAHWRARRKATAARLAEQLRARGLEHLLPEEV